MSATKNIIVFNGKKYDVTTGRPINGSHRAKPAHHGIKDTVKEEKPHKHRKPAHKKAPHAKRKTQKSSTLMRSGLKKPDYQKSEAKTPEKPMPRVGLPTDKERERRAKQVPKSKKITKFNFASISKTITVKKVQNLAVKKPSNHHIPATKPATRQRSNDWPVLEQFEKAMEEASSHLEEFVDETTHSKKGRKFGYVFASLAVLLIVGFGAYSLVPAAKVKLAANKAGFPAEIPGYSPAGYGLADPVETDYGKVALSYKSRTDDKEFKLTQEPSQWSSETLANNFLNTSNKQYETISGSGHTIYNYDGSNATWVNGGIWFKIEGNAELTEDQLIKIANSL